jgi:hypothetical protein
MKRKIRLAKTMAQDKSYLQCVCGLVHVFYFRETLYMRFQLLPAFALSMMTALGQENGFEFGKVSYDELDMKKYERDTTAAAVVLNEFGEAYFDLENLNKIYLKYHIKIKILKEDGKKYADFEIPLRKSSSTSQEVVRSIKAVSLNREGNSWKETPLQSKNIFNENFDKDWSVAKFAVPNVRVGSVIDVYYELESPYTYNFVPWHFQTDIPKMKSEFWAQYPAYYQYHITLKGFLPLTLNKAEVIKSCVGSTGGYGNSGADCTLFKYGMENIPAFKEEAFMTAKRNYISAIAFELEQITQRNGAVDKVTNEWKDAERELKEHELFGIQIKRARNLYEEKAKAMRTVEAEPMALMKNIHDYCKNTFTWDGELDFLTDKGVKKTQETLRGNVADINLTMLAILQEAGIYAEPVLLATRARGQPIQLYPVLSDFNYVLVRARVGDKYFFLDATSPLNTVGFVPEKCLNGQGRALGETSAWIDLKPIDKRRIVSDYKIKLDESGAVTGNATISHYGYAAATQRYQFLGRDNVVDYVKHRTEQWIGVEASEFAVENERDLTKPFMEKFNVALEDADNGANIVYFPPFLFQRNDKNPFASTERLYPVDLGVPVEYIYLLSLEFPQTYNVEELPKPIALAMPNSGGRFLFSINSLEGKLTLSCNLSLTKPLYTAAEYHALREIYARYIATLQSIIVLKKK